VTAPAASACAVRPPAFPRTPAHAKIDLPVTALRQWLAAATAHALTASGAVWALLALIAVADGRFRAALGWMFLAVIIDGVDGALARRAQVTRVLPGIDGTLLDNLVDYANYVLVPAFLIHRAALLPPAFSVFGAAAICLASAFQFSQADAKTDDHYFKGFPSYWNVVAFYLLVLGTGPWTNLAVVFALCVLVFAPVYWVYPSRTRAWRVPTLVLSALWGVLLAAILASYPEHEAWLAWVSLLFVVYYVLLSVALTAERRREA